MFYVFLILVIILLLLLYKASSIALDIRDIKEMLKNALEKEQNK